MPVFARSVKLRSLALWPAVLTFGIASAGCIIVDDNRCDDWNNDCTVVQEPPIEQPSPEILQVSIDPDTVFNDVVPGEGVGLFLEYGTGGKWRLWTACDTNYSNVACAFDATVSVDSASEILSVEGEDLEGFDDARMIDAGAAAFMSDTGSDTDGMLFETTPGATVRLDMALDGKSEPRFVFWFGDGVLHKGAPSNPVDFLPTAP